MSQMPPTVAIITHPSQNNTSDTLKLQAHASVESLDGCDGAPSYQRTRATVEQCQLIKDESSHTTRQSMCCDTPNM